MLDENSSIVVTGGAGFIGSAVVWALNNLGFDNIIIVDNLGSGDKWKNLVNRQYKYYLHHADFLRQIKTETFTETPNAVIHLGACSSTTERDANYLYQNNTVFSQEVCNFALKNKARFINASSAATFGNGENGFANGADQIEILKPLNMYGYSKHLFDLWLKKNNLLSKVASIKFFNVYGPNEYHKNNMASVVFKAFNHLQTNDELSLFKSNDHQYRHGEQKRDFIYIKDAVQIIINLLKNPNLNGIFNAGSGVARTWNDLAASVFKAMRKPEKIIYRDFPPELNGKYQNFTRADMRWLHQIWPDFHFHTLEEGITDYIVNYLQKNDQYLEMRTK